MEDFWATMETEVIEQVAFPASIPITKFDASVIAPFFPPLMRGAVVVNTEKDKNLDVQPVPGKATWWLTGVREGPSQESRTLSMARCTNGRAGARPTLGSFWKERTTCDRSPRDESHGVEI